MGKVRQGQPSGQASPRRLGLHMQHNVWEEMDGDGNIIQVSGAEHVFESIGTGMIIWAKFRELNIKFKSIGSR